jgi:hypothetical protein
VRSDTSLDTLLQRLVAQSAGIVESHRSTDGAARVLLADMLACVAGCRPEQPRTPAKPVFDSGDDGTCGRVAALALRAHAQDLDDIFWPTGTHIGSIVWPVALALGAEVGADGALILRAASTGYQIAGDIAALLGPVHGGRWHATATAGAVGSAAVAAVLLALDESKTVAACGHAAAMAGGVGQSVTERSPTVAFHRASAAITGLLAARFARTGAAAPARVLEGPRGVLALLAPDARGLLESRDDNLLATSVRLFPVNGFCQGAVALAAELRRRFDTTRGKGGARTAKPRSILVEVGTPVAAMTTGDVGGDWWDMRGAVAAAWTSGDEFRLERTDDSWALREAVRVVGTGGDVRATRVVVQMTDDEMGAELAQPPGYRPTDPDSLRLLQRKWFGLGAEDPFGPAERILDSGVRMVDLEALLRGSSTGQEMRA